jgi:hypothetical protein
MFRKFRVWLYRASPEEKPEVMEFVFAAAAKEHARTELKEGRACKVVVENPDGTVILTLPR